MSPLVRRRLARGLPSTGSRGWFRSRCRRLCSPSLWIGSGRACRPRSTRHRSISRCRCGNCCYEAAYFALFGVAAFTRGARRVALLLLLGLVAGLNILLLLPVWLLGVGLHGCLARNLSPSGPLAWVMAVAPVLLYAAALTLGFPGDLRALTLETFSGHGFRFSDEFIWNSLGSTPINSCLSV